MRYSYFNLNTIMKKPFSQLFSALLVSVIMAFCSQGYARPHVNNHECCCCKNGNPSKSCCCKKEKNAQKQSENGNECGCISQTPESKQAESVSAPEYSFSIELPHAFKIVSFPDLSRLGLISLCRQSPPGRFPRLTIPLLI